MNKRILISCPISGRSWILPHYLKSILKLDYPKKLIDIYWIVNNSKDNSIQLLQDFKEQYKNEYNSIYIEIFNNKSIPPDERTKGLDFKTKKLKDVRTQYIYSWLAELRNKILDKCDKLNCDYLLSSDSDIILKPCTLNRLIENDKDICSCLIYNGYLYDRIENGYKYTNMLKKDINNNYVHIVNYKTKYPFKNTNGTIIPVDFSGACMLIKKEVCQNKNIRFSWYSQGEDEPFSKSAILQGFKFYGDISLYQNHIMSPECLEYYLEGKIDSHFYLK
jgi:cellulose synthase/poly-beta-1,6-N-acetylglucosamine synthase-like glycosyltransferase